MFQVIVNKIGFKCLNKVCGLGLTLTLILPEQICEKEMLDVFVLNIRFYLHIKSIKGCEDVQYTVDLQSEHSEYISSNKRGE